MSKQHPNVKALRAFNRWRRGGSGPQPAPSEVGHIIDWAITVCEASDRLINAKGKHAETAYGRLEAAVNGSAGEAQEVGRS